MLRSRFLSNLFESRSAVSEEKSKMYQPIMGHGNLFLPIGPKHTDLKEDAEILLPVKFRLILLSGFWEEFKNVSANPRLWRPSCFPNRPEKHKLGRGRWDLASCQVSWIPFSGFSEEVENVWANQRPGRPSFFTDRPEKHKLGGGHCDILFCQVLLNSVQR